MKQTRLPHKTPLLRESWLVSIIALRRLICLSLARILTPAYLHHTHQLTIPDPFEFDCSLVLLADVYGADKPEFVISFVKYTRQ